MLAREAVCPQHCCTQAFSVVATVVGAESPTLLWHTHAHRPLEEPFVRKWQLACENDIAHVVVMPNITIAKLEEFVQVRGGWTFGCMWIPRHVCRVGSTAAKVRASARAWQLFSLQRKFGGEGCQGLAAVLTPTEVWW
eukprot:1159959-Pelagomonas_calceolata.AAC.7